MYWSQTERESWSLNFTSHHLAHPRTVSQGPAHHLYFTVSQEEPLTTRTLLPEDFRKKPLTTCTLLFRKDQLTTRTLLFRKDQLTTCTLLFRKDQLTTRTLLFRKDQLTTCTLLFRKDQLTTRTLLFRLPKNPHRGMHLLLYLD